MKKNDNKLPDSAFISGVEHNDIMWGYYRADTCFVTDLNRKMVLDAFVENWTQGYKDEFVKDEYYGLNRYVHQNRHIP